MAQARVDISGAVDITDLDLETLLDAMWDSATLSKESEILSVLVDFIADKGGTGRLPHMAFLNQEDVKEFAMSNLGLVEAAKEESS